MGGLTTYSSFNLETTQFIQNRAWYAALVKLRESRSVQLLSSRVCWGSYWLAALSRIIDPRATP